MASYLEDYGAAEDQSRRRRSRIKWAIVTVLGLAVLGIVVYGIFKNYPEERQAKNFLAALRSSDYQGAYRMWGCSEAAPCRDYSFNKFMEDWGQTPNHPDFRQAQISASQSCGTGVMLQLNPPSGDPVMLWVERNTHVLSFAPWPQCPGRRWHFGAFLRKLFNR